MIAKSRRTMVSYFNIYLSNLFTLLHVAIWFVHFSAFMAKWKKRSFQNFNDFNYSKQNKNEMK